MFWCWVLGSEISAHVPKQAGISSVHMNTLDSSSSCLFSSSICCENACLLLESCEIRLSFSSSCRASSPLIKEDKISFSSLCNIYLSVSLSLLIYKLWNISKFFLQTLFSLPLMQFCFGLVWFFCTSASCKEEFAELPHGENCVWSVKAVYIFHCREEQKFPLLRLHQKCKFVECKSFMLLFSNMHAALR